MDTHPVGTGPYQVKDYVYNQYVRLIRNEAYWEKKAKIENIIVDLSADRTGRLIKFLIMNVKSRLIPKSANSAC